MTRTPDTIHFIYPVTEKTRPWSFINHVTVLLARKIHNPDRIIIWSNRAESSGGLMATALTANAEARYIPLPICYSNGVPVGWPQYMSDIMRLRILLEHGGIYMDTDMLLLKPLHEYMSDTLVFSWENQLQSSISNALMMAPPENRFLEEWSCRLIEGDHSNVWAYGGVVMPAALASDQALAPYRRIYPHNFCCPLDLSREWLTDPALADDAERLIQGSAAIHVFETYWRDQLKGVDEEHVRTKDSLFSRIVKKHLKGEVNV